MLKEKTIFENIDKVAMAIKRIQAYTPKNGYYLAFSGGKDSIVIKTLADMAEVKYDAHFNVSGGLDPPELIKFIKKHHSDVEIIKAEKSIYEAMLEKVNGWPPTRTGRWCCRLYKEKGGKDRIVMTGIRKAESTKRSKRRMFEACHSERKWYLHPIIDWTENEVWEFIKIFELPYCKLYDEGYKRIGCIMCPQSGFKRMKEDAERFPRVRKKWKKALKKLLKQKPHLTFKDEEEFYEFWIGNTGSRSRKYDSQRCFVFDND